ncbi:MAG: glycosytransferase, partial [Pseudomonadota bacterium]
MIEPRMPRVMWLLNHGSARKFEVAMLKSVGIQEIFLPKKYPNDPSFRSASIDYSEDHNLTIPADQLAVLNATDWYETQSLEAWDIANRYFDVLFFIAHRPDSVKGISRNFRGIMLWRAYGMERNNGYSKVQEYFSNILDMDYIRAMGKRLFFVPAYSHLHLIESIFLQERSLYLPLGLANCTVYDQWRGGEKKILFVCPDIGFNPYYQAVYQSFIRDFKGLPYAVGGAQPIPLDDPNIIGFVPWEAHEKNMQEMRVMFYHSTEPNHVHYHPFEAIRAGMPLIFMGNGMLDRLGGTKLPGRCTYIAQARHKISRILNGDQQLIEAIRTSQTILLEQMKPANCVDTWRSGFKKILMAVETIKNVPVVAKVRKRRVAVILPVGYRGGTLQGAKLLAHAMLYGSCQAGQDVDVILGHLDDPACYPDEAFDDLPDTIKRRPYNWRTLNRDESNRAVAYAGITRTLTAENYIVPDDGISQFMDCDLWILVSDRLSMPILPVRPYVLMVYDYLQRYEPVMSPILNQAFVMAAHAAARVFVTTEFTRQDAIQFGGIPANRVVKLPILAPLPNTKFSQIESQKEAPESKKYFLWATNLALHKNHENAVRALRQYYEEFDGKFACYVTGVDTDRMLDTDRSQLKPVQKIITTSPLLQRQIKFMGELTTQSYHDCLANCAFMWHAGRIDNGTFSVVEAAHLGRPSLSSDYPAM